MSRLSDQLRVLRARLALDPDNRVLRVEIAAGRRTLRRLARDARVEPLPELLARLGAGEISADQAGVAIQRDQAVAAQVVRAASFDGAQLGDVKVGELAGGNIYHIHYGTTP